MIVLSELLTILIGLLLAIVLVDGIRRALRVRKKNLEFASKFIELEDEMELKQELIEEDNEDAKLDNPKEIIPRSDLRMGQLLIIYLQTDEEHKLSLSSMKSDLELQEMSFNDKGFFFFNSAKLPYIHFTLLNGIKPGHFEPSVEFSLVSIVLDTQRNSNPVEAFEKMLELSEWFSSNFKAIRLDESRNPLTKQMLDHMRQKAQDDQRQSLSNSNIN